MPGRAFAAASAGRTPLAVTFYPTPGAFAHPLIHAMNAAAVMGFFDLLGVAEG